jgi:hypothetical protein
VNHPRRQRLVRHVRGGRGGGRRQPEGAAGTRTEGLSEEEPERDELRKDGGEGDDQFQRATSAVGRTWRLVIESLSDVAGATTSLMGSRGNMRPVQRGNGGPR